MKNIQQAEDYPANSIQAKWNPCLTHFMVIGNLQLNNFGLFGWAKKQTWLMQGISSLFKRGKAESKLS